MDINNLRSNISLKNDARNFALYAHLPAKGDKSSYIKDLLEIKLLKEMVKKQNLKKYRTLVR